jgi:hypothetical protein
VSADAHQKVIWLYIAVNKIFIVNKFDAAYHLIGQHEHGLHGEAPRAKIEQVLETRAEQVHDEYVVVFFLAVPANVRYAHAALQNFVQFTFVKQLRVARFY